MHFKRFFCNRIPNFYLQNLSFSYCLIITNEKQYLTFLWCLVNMLIQLEIMILRMPANLACPWFSYFINKLTPQWISMIIPTKLIYTCFYLYWDSFGSEFWGFCILFVLCVWAVFLHGFSRAHKCNHSNWADSSFKVV